MAQHHRDHRLWIRGATGRGGDYTPASGLDVAPEKTDPADDFQTEKPSSPHTVVTGSDGTVTRTFMRLGWNRLKAAGSDSSVTGVYGRCNRVDVCVEATRGAGCGPLPADDQVRCVAAVGCGTAETPTSHRRARGARCRPS